MSAFVVPIRIVGSIEVEAGTAVEAAEKAMAMPAWEIAHKMETAKLFVGEPPEITLKEGT